MNMKPMLVLLMIACLAFAAAAQERLTNDSVLKMVKAGLSDELIINIIKTQPATFSLKTDDIIALKQAGVSDKILSAMVDKNAPPAAPAPPAVSSSETSGADKTATAEGSRPLPQSAPAASDTANATPPVSEVGVYYRKDNKWEPLVPELVTWKSGGVFKAIRTVGRERGEMTGRIAGIRSRTSLNLPLDILIYAPFDEPTNTYGLFRLRQQDGWRQFRALGGKASKDAITFEARKIAPRSFEAALPALPPGEYGIMAVPPPAPATPPSMASSEPSTQPREAQQAAQTPVRSGEPPEPQVSKMYTFRIGD